MKLHRENVDINEVIELFKIKEKFISNKDIDIAYYILMEDIINYFDLDRIYIGMKSKIENKCIPVVEYLKGKEPNFLGDTADFSEFIKFTDMSISKNEQEYINVCGENNYFIGDEFNKLSHLLPHLGYINSPKGNPSECLIFSTQNKESFTFMFMERYEEKENQLSVAQRLALADIYNTLSFRLEKTTLENRLHNEIHTKNAIIQNEKTPICILGKSDTKVIYFNDHYKELMPDIKLGLNYCDLIRDEQGMQAINDSESLILKYNENKVKYWIKKIIPIVLADGTESYMVYIKDTDDYIQKLQGIDLLTSAYSINGFTKCFKELMVKNPKQDYTLCTIDISKFKYINDSYGFAVGNKILQKIADVLSKFVRSQEAFCRMNEDKFAILFQCSTTEEVRARINGLFKKLDDIQDDIHDEQYLDMQLIYICGATAVDKDVEINILIDRANTARKTIKSSHKSALSFFDEKAEAKVKNELSMEARVAKAVSDGEFVPYLQPKFDLRTMKICGAEALVRWITPTGMIFPDSFIPLFEKNGFIDTLDFIIYQKTMEHIRSCIDRNLPVYPVSLNVSRNHIHNKNFVTQIMELINKYKIPIDLIELEITESVFVEDREVLKFFIDNIKRPKIKVSIDDFGTAYSSLQVLKDIDIDILKIDKGFLENIDFTDRHTFTKDEIVLKNIINLAKELNCKVICEGIETNEQIELLKNIGCEFGQGYVFARPMPITDYEKDFLNITL